MKFTWYSAKNIMEMDIQIEDSLITKYFVKKN